MNSFIEILNLCGRQFLSFAWPMLWQSSLLIASLFAVDLLFRRKLRASIRYALWLVVLVKLCVPPTLALPTSPAWWLHKTPPSAVAKAEPRYTVTYDNTPLPDMAQTPLPAFVPAKPKMTNAAWLLVASAAISAGLLCWLLVRWWQITRLVRLAAASERLTSISDAAQGFVGMRLKVQVKLTTNSMSPAVCGLFYPAILIPQPLAENFSDEQLRAVLLHELIHLRRRDVCVNFVQALLQIVYWWHPLVWLANARIRRVREEAVDDAVMLALRDEAEAYAPTLLEVAKLALNRPLASLGLVGIIESRSALRQRIERLVNFRPPRKAGLTLVSLLGILAFTAVAVPMGEGPAPVGNPSAVAAAAEEEQTLTVKVDPELFIRNVRAQAELTMHATNDAYTDILLDILRREEVDTAPPHGLAFNTHAGEITTQNKPEQLVIFRQVIEQLNRTDGKCELPLRNNFHRKSVLIEARIYQMPAGGFKKIVSGLQSYPGGQGSDAWWSVSPEKFQQFVGSLELSGLRLIQRPRIQTGSGMIASFYVGDATNSVAIDCKPFAADGSVELTMQSTVISVRPANAFTNHFGIRAAAEEHGGIVVRVENFNGDAGSNLVVVIGVEILTNNPSSRYQQSLAPAGAMNVTGALSDPNFRVVLKALEQRTGSETFTEPVVVTTSGRNVNRMRTDNISAMLAHPVSESSNQINMPFKLDHSIRHDELMEKLRAAGVNTPTTVSFYEDHGILVARGSEEQLALVNRLVLKLNGFSPKEIEAGDKYFHSHFPPQHSEIEFVYSIASAATNLFSRHFKVGTDTFAGALRKITGMQTNDVVTMARSFFSTLGVNLDLPGKSVFYGDRLGELFVRATPQDLDTIENALEVLDRAQAPPQIHIKARFLEVPKGTLAGLNNIISVTNPPALSNQGAGLVGILTDKNFRTVWHNLEARSGVETLGEPEVVTTSGRQTQMRATRLTTKEDVVFDVVVSRPVKSLEFGPVLDVVPYVLSDGYTINLTLNPSLMEPLVSSNSVPKNLPDFRVRQVVTTLNLWDNQTAIISGLPEKDYVDGKEVFDKSKASDKELLVFITATIVDPAGNRVHSDDELRAKTGVPTQPAQLPSSPK